MEFHSAPKRIDEAVIDAIVSGDAEATLALIAALMVLALIPGLGDRFPVVVTILVGLGLLAGMT